MRSLLLLVVVLALLATCAFAGKPIGKHHLAKASEVLSASEGAAPITSSSLRSHRQRRQQRTRSISKAQEEMVGGVFPPTSPEPHRVRPVSNDEAVVAGVFPPSSPEPHRVRAEAVVAGVFPPSSPEPHLTRKARKMHPTRASPAVARTAVPAEASVSPIPEDKPSWASDADVCSAVKSCDECRTDYCFYSVSGQASCCARGSQ